MRDFVERRFIGIVTWMLGISWLFHVYLLAGAAIRDDVYARNWELIIVMLHHIWMIALFVVCYRRGRRDGSL